MRAAGAHEADVRAEPHDLPVAAPARVLLAEPETVTEAEIERRGHRQGVPSDAVTPVKLNDPR